jgi:hypothetical protein
MQYLLVRVHVTHALTNTLYVLYDVIRQQIYRLFTAELVFDAKRLKHAMDFVAQAIANKSKDPQSQFNETIDYINTQVNTNTRCAF